MMTWGIAHCGRLEADGGERRDIGEDRGPPERLAIEGIKPRPRRRVVLAAAAQCLEHGHFGLSRRPFGDIGELALELGHQRLSLGRHPENLAVVVDVGEQVVDRASCAVFRITTPWGGFVKVSGWPQSWMVMGKPAVVLVPELEASLALGVEDALAPLPPHPASTSRQTRTASSGDLVPDRLPSLLSLDSLSFGYEDLVRAVGHLSSLLCAGLEVGGGDLGFGRSMRVHEPNGLVVQVNEHDEGLYL